jgi:hypothetical protein
MIRRLVIAALALAMVVAVWMPAYAQKEFDLPEVLTTPDGSLSVRCPAGWVTSVVTPDLLMVGTSGALDPDSETLTEDELIVIILAPSLVMLPFVDDGSPVTIDDVVEVMTTGTEEDIVYGEPEEATVAGRAAVLVPSVATDSHALLAAVSYGDTYLVAIAVGSVDGFADQHPLVLAIFDTLTYIGPGAVTPFTTAAGDLTLEYPSVWVAFETMPGRVTIADRLPDLDGSGRAESPPAVMVRVVPIRALMDLNILGIFGDLDRIEADRDLTGSADLFFEMFVDDEAVEQVVRDVRWEENRACIRYVREDQAGYVLAREYEGGMVVIWAVADQAALDAYTTQIDAIVDSIQYPPADS